MKIRSMMVFFLLFYGGFATAYDLNGSMSNNGDGTYSVSVENDNGHSYDGTASDNGDGTMDVSVEDANGESYSGTATDNSDGTYDLDLSNESSGGDAGGTVQLDN